ncbi:MAG: hypothetical protein H6983_21985 [Ectothiorhodospiraceae bacterium]|nr:hypothetical protein [Chromatiales bacterium]MCP5156862.1 hypothetical protein [Ectothiorhodospiraceae bacterium]
MWGLFRSPEREARRLVRDARAVVEMAAAALPAPTTRAIASMAREHRDRALATVEAEPARREVLIGELRTRHREARRRRDDVELTAYTLVIIYLESLPLGARAADARATVDEFIASVENGLDA